MADNIAQLLKKNHYELEAIQRNSSIWFETQAFNLFEYNDVTPKQALQGDARKLKTTFDLGSMYFFMYEAKHADKLPYYDMFPLVLPFSVTKNGFVGLNLHYLPYDLRIRLLSKLQEFRTSNALTPQTKIRFQWDLLQAVARGKGTKACVKQYLGEQVRSPFRLVPPDDWATACMLPLERFTGSDKFQVWTDSLRKL